MPPGTTSDLQLMTRAVHDLVARTRFPVAFGGLVREHSVHVSSIVGARGRTIEGLIVREQRGLGGRALTEKRPRLALDYRSARGITHDYDGPILGEGIATLFAVPVIAAGRTRGVLYCGSWGQTAVDDVTAAPALKIADALASELRIRDEVARRVERAEDAAPERAWDAAAREQVRESFAQLRAISATVSDAALRERLAAVERRLAEVVAGDRPASSTAVQLSPRELDVLACAALGSTNAQIAQELALKETTVKSYLAAAMSKLEATTRHAAVAKARRARLLP